MYLTVKTYDNLRGWGQNYPSLQRIFVVSRFPRDSPPDTLIANQGIQYLWYDGSFNCTMLSACFDSNEEIRHSLSWIGFVTLPIIRPSRATSGCKKPRAARADPSRACLEPIHMRTLHFNGFLVAANFAATSVFRTKLNCKSLKRMEAMK